MDDVCKTKTLGGLVLQENGIIRNYNGRIIAHLIDDVGFDSEHIAHNVMYFNPVIDTCDHGHKYAKLEDHPKDKSGRPRCPVCMSTGLDLSRKKFDWFVKWFTEGRKRAEIVPFGHIQPYTEFDVDVAIENLVKE